MAIPIYHFLNQKYKSDLSQKKYLIKGNQQLNFLTVKNSEFPIFKFFQKLDKRDPANLIKFNVANEYAVNLFKNNVINYTDIYRIIVKISSLDLKFKLKNIKDIIKYHELLERKINENQIN